MPRADWRRRRDARLDSNGDGVISGEERDAAMKERMANMRTRLDADGDGKVSPAELAAARGRMHFDNAEALDINHDGDISAEELAAGFKARRDQWRTTRGGGASGAGADGTAGGSSNP
jgi:Ca2+-binding EF-hand superfamily protein